MVKHPSLLLCPKIESVCCIKFFLHDTVPSPVQVFVSWIQEVKQTWRQPSILCSAIIKVQSAHCFAETTCTPLTHQRSSQVGANDPSNGKCSLDHYPTTILFDCSVQIIRYLCNLSHFLNELIISIFFTFRLFHRPKARLR